MKPSGIIEENRRLRVSRYFIPKQIRLEGDRLYWQWPIEWREVKPTLTTFEELVALAEAPDKEILRFAKKWGVLWLCKKHQEPGTDPRHQRCTPLNPNPDPVPTPALAKGLQGEAPNIWREDYVSEGEPVEAYRRWSRLAGAILRICERHDDGKPALAEDWQVLWDDRWFAEGDKFTWRQDRNWSHWDVLELSVEKQYMIRALNRWLEIGDVRPQLITETDNDPTLKLHTTGLAGAIAVALLESAGRYVIAGCSGCRKFYRPNIRPKSGQDRYCQACRDAKVPEARANHRKALCRREARIESTKRTTKARKRS